MAERIFKGKDEVLTYEEADAMADEALTQLLFYMRQTAEAATDDEDELADLTVNLSTYVGTLRNACVLKGLLMDPARYLEELGLPDGVAAGFEEVR
jgi:hypothetical protein